MSDEQTRMIQERDGMIESLKFELADLHFKLAEQEHLGDGRLQALETDILETKMKNARLLEENESFQMLLSEKTLKGDFMPEQRSADDTPGMSSLAEELESVDDEASDHSDAYRRLEAENKTLREGNKALTLYVDKIIGRLLQHEGFEHIILDKDEPPAPPSKPAAAEKALPATPDPGAPTQPPSQPPMGFLQRARSVVARPTPGKPRPQSYMPPAPASANQNPQTAPRIPLNRGHRRARSDQAQNELNGPGAAVVVQQMNRASTFRTPSGGPGSPGISPLNAQFGQTRPSYFVNPTTSNPAASTTTGRAPSTSDAPGRDSSANSVASEQSLERGSTDGSSAQTGGHGANNPPLPGAVMKQNTLRPLRLVQAQSEEDDERKRANRGSWMGWFKASTVETQQN